MLFKEPFHLHRQGHSAARLLGLTLTALTAEAVHAEDVNLETLQVVSDRIRDDRRVDQYEVARKQANDLEDLFRDEPAIDVGGAFRAGQKLYIRGIEDTNLNVTIDGARQSGYLFHHTSRLSVEPLLLKSAEIETSPGAADNGPGALGGSVRFTTKDAQDLLKPGQRFGALVKGSTESAADAIKGTTALYGEIAPDAGLLFMTTARNSDDYRDGNGDTAERTGGQQRGYLAKFSLLDSGPHSLRLSAERSTDSGVYCVRPHMECQPFNNSPVDTELRRDTYTASWGFDPAARLVDVHTNVYYTESTLDRRSLDSGTRSKASMDTLGSDLRNTFHFGPEAFDARLTVGSDYFHDESKDRSSGAATYSETAENLGLYAQQRLSTGPLDWSFGMRFDDYRTEYANGEELDGSELSPNARLTWHVVGGVSLFAGYSEAVRGAKGREVLLANNGVEPGQTLNVVSGLKAEESKSVEWGASFEHRGLVTATDRFSATATVFDTQIKHFIDFDSDTNTIENRDGDVTSQGYEARLGYALGGFESSLGYAHTELEDQNGDAITDSMGLGAGTGDKWVLDTRYNFAAPDLTLGWAVTAVERFDDGTDASSEKPGYAVHDVYASWVPAELPDLTVTAGIYNLFDKAYYDQATFLLGSNPARGIEPGALNEPGRDVRLSVAYTF